MRVQVREEHFVNASPPPFIGCVLFVLNGVELDLWASRSKMKIRGCRAQWETSSKGLRSVLVPSRLSLINQAVSLVMTYGCFKFH